MCFSRKKVKMVDDVLLEKKRNGSGGFIVKEITDKLLERKLK